VYLEGTTLIFSLIFMFVITSVFSDVQVRTCEVISSNDSKS
jgi:hypothetical protein